ncbi:MAG: ester cyclase [Alphaproteobacteria bacterium]|nr:ester cyclase [Alphaproteobacteria bacterium]
MESDAVIRSMAEEIWGERNLDALDKWYSPAFSNYVGATGHKTSVSMLRQGLSIIFSAFSNTRLEVLQQVTHGEMVASRLMLYGVHTGEFMGVAPTHTDIMVAGSRFDRVQHGKIVEHSSMLDIFSILNQIQKKPPIKM